MKLLVCAFLISTLFVNTSSVVSAQSTATVINTGGLRLNCRESYPSGTIIARLNAGSQVTLLGESQNGWYPVQCGGKQGWAFAQYLQVGTSVPSTPPPSSSPSTTLYVNTAKGTNLNCRDMYPSGAIIGKLSSGQAVTTRGSQVNGWWPIVCNGKNGWASSAYLTAGKPTTPTIPTPTETPNVPLSTAQYAVQYVGYGYAVAGKNPSTGFDCAGFVYWVILNTQGINIGTGTNSQSTYGTAIPWGEWQSGDLVFFVGTGGTGGFYSHVGIYVGNGQFVHAQNASTGVVISSIYSEYYSSHYAMARRL